MNATFTVAPLGKRVLLKDFLSRAILYLISASFAGSIVGFLYSSIVYILTFFIPYNVKVIILVLLLGLFVLHEANLIKLKIPQNKWQVPSSWISGNPNKDMVLWGLILGSGIFTYIPHISFHILYIYIGMVTHPVLGLAFGAIYGFSRTVPASLFAATRIFNPESMFEINQAPMIRRFNRTLNFIILFLIVGFIINQFYQSNF